MDHNKRKITPQWILILQIMSLAAMWIFVTGISTWIINLINLSIYLKDAQNATLGISLVVMPVYLLLASVLTYVFVGLRRGRKQELDEK